MHHSRWPSCGQEAKQLASRAAEPKLAPSPPQEWVEEVQTLRDEYRQALDADLFALLDSLDAMLSGIHAAVPQSPGLTDAPLLMLTR